MSRMRQHVFTEMDKNGDKMISLEEFVAETQDNDFKDNEEWKVSLFYEIYIRFRV